MIRIESPGLHSLSARLPKYALCIFILLSVFRLGAQTCPNPIPLSVQNIDTNSALVNWFHSAQADSFDIIFRKLPDAFPGEPQITGITGLSYQFSGLEAGAVYDYRVRARCGNLTSQWSPNGRFITHLTNPSNCSIYLPITDNNCGSGGNLFKIIVGDQSGLLGIDVFIREVRMIASHSWPADLRVFLRNPGGIEIPLTTDNGIGGNHYGNPESADCLEATVFSDNACVSVSAASPPFIGEFIPEAPLSNLHDHSPAKGTWELFICDKAPGDVGELIYFEIVFESFNCRPPIIEQVADITDTSLQLHLSSLENCDSITILAGPPGFDPLSGEESLRIIIPCDSQIVEISNLIPGQDYEIYIFSLCGTDTSTLSCPIFFSTLCSTPALRSDFNSEFLCDLVCNSFCPLTGIWRNQEESLAYWLVNEGPTPTENTGPESSFGGSGHYLFYQSAGLQCQSPSRAILESACIDIRSNGGNCDMSFRYHQWGPQVGGLKLLLSVDGGFIWDTLWINQTPQPNEWLEAIIDLSDYDGMTGRFRFVAEGGSGPLGDIGLDEILIFNSALADTLELIYFIDNDGDGYGQDGTGTFFCTNTPPEGWAAVSGDCDDDNPNINPGAEVIPCNLIDENCTGLEDDQPEENPIVAELLEKVNESCSGASDGSISISMSGGFPPYTITWNNQDTGTSISGLSAGVYFAIVEDSSGCLFRTPFYTLQESSSMSFSFTNVVRPTCSSFSDGSIELLTGGGTPPFEYLWSNGDTTSVIDGLSEGKYSVTVSDAAGCVFASTEFRLIAQNPFSVNVVEKISPACNGLSNGSLRVQMQGGQAPFSTQWSTGQAGILAEDLSSGFYSVTVTDSTDCTLVLDSIYLSEPAPLTVDFFSVIPPLCPGESTGRILTALEGGTFPFTFLWQSGNRTYTTSDLLNVRGGEYQFRVTDQNGCSFEANVLLPEPDPFQLQINSLKPVSCGTRSDGSIETEITGGIAPYQIFWNTGQRDTLHIDSLSEGFYRLTLTDQAGCKFTSEVLELKNSNLSLGMNLQILDSVSCSGAIDGAISVEVDSDHLPIRFNWNHKPLFEAHTNRDTIIGLGSNFYSVSVMDASSCMGQSPNLFLPDPPELIITEILRKLPGCNGDGDGELELIHIGGTSPYFYQWSSGDTTKIASGLTAGTYSVTVTDRNGCQKHRNNIFLQEPPPFEVQFTSGPDDGSGNGFIELSMQGGIPPYEINLIPEAGIIENGQISNLPHGEYLATVTDANGCALDSLINIELVNPVQNFANFEVRIFPNPTKGLIVIEFPEDANGSDIEWIKIYDSAGRLVKSFNPFPGHPAGRMEVDVSKLPSGIYLINIESKGETFHAVFGRK